jgi:hypothetical protein
VEKHRKYKKTRGFKSTSVFLEFDNVIDGLPVIGTVGAVINSITLSTDVSTVPVPAAIWLFDPALIGLIGFNKRTRKHSIKSSIAA